MNKDIPSNAGRRPKIDPITFRCSVNFNAREQAQLESLYEKSGIQSMSAFIKLIIFNKPIKIFVVDENTRKFISQLSSFYSHYRTLVIDYDELVKTLRSNFTEKKAMRILYNLEKKTVELVKTNREIVALAKQFDEQWLQKST